MDDPQVRELLYQALETELGGVQIYETAVKLAVNEDLKEEWQKYLEETREHVEIVTQVLEDLDMDPAVETDGRKVVRYKGEALIHSMEMAKAAGDPAAAQLVAAEAVVDAEIKDHSNWELIGRIAEKASGKTASVLQEAYDKVEEEEDEHLYHTMGWARELWIESLGMPAVLPPPEERKDVKTAIGASRAEQAREEMVGKKA
jgi:rubrerythrin